MVVRISRLLLDAICIQAKESDPFECCGLLLGQASDGVAEVMELRPAANIAAQPRHHFEVDPAVLIAAHRQARGGGLEILGHYHSHPRGEAVPSIVDATMAQAKSEIWLLTGGDGASMAWRAISGGSLHGCFEPVELNVSP